MATVVAEAETPVHRAAMETIRAGAGVAGVPPL